jgi:hypothetical protein
MAKERFEGIERYDAKERWRCPMLGGPVTFGYCRRFNEGLFCARLLECWIQQLPLVEFLKAHYAPEEIRAAFAAENKGRLARMMEAVEEAQKADPPDAD